VVLRTATHRTAKTPLAEAVEFFYEVEQKSTEWHELRRGLVTASKLSVVLATGKNGGDSVGRDKYMKMLAGEIVTGQIAESFRNEYMERGNRMEAEAREWYERTRLVDLTPVGFVKRTIPTPLGASFVIGASPDSQVNERKGIEIKSMAPHLLYDAMKRGAAGFPPEHRAQLQGTMRVCGWDQMDLILFYTGWPRPPVFTVDRDEAYIQRIDAEVEKFDYELRRMVEEIRR
jgi:YqaJ-like viral recombinase domain